MADKSVTAANVLASANAKLARGVAGETITAGQVLYKLSSDQRLYLADANASAATADAVGIALHGAALGQPIEYVEEDPDFSPGFTLVLSVAADSGVYVLSATPGGVAPMDDLAAAMFPVVLMVAKSTTKANLKIVKSTTTALIA